METRVECETCISLTNGQLNERHWKLIAASNNGCRRFVDIRDKAKYGKLLVRITKILYYW